MQNGSTIILAIESSCDETAASVSINKKIESNVIYSQSIHTKFGGVFPEFASREHIKKIIYCTEEALHKANVKKKDLSAIAYTKGPGLLGSLMVGVTFAKSLAYTLNIPTISINHIKAHIFSIFIDNQVNFPFLSIVISGGHTILAIVKGEFDLEIIGETLDDAIGEAFDKVAKILGLPYPGGPIINKMAEKGNEDTYSFPDTKISNLDLSFSGIKTGFLYFVKRQVEKNPNFIQENIYDICASIQKKLIEMIEDKLLSAIEDSRSTNVAFCGGVAANTYLRKRMDSLKKKLNLNIFFPRKEHCTDNAAMVAILADIYYKKKLFSTQYDEPKARMSLKESL